MYDIFYVCRGAANKVVWEDFKQRYPNAQLIENNTSFEEVKSKSFTKFFWVVWDHTVVSNDFQFDYRIPKWDEDYIHVFRNGKFFDGICIFSKKSKILGREWEYRFFTKKKEIDVEASKFYEYDIVFISYNEPQAKENYFQLNEKVTRPINWVYGVKGIHQAHIEAAKMCKTDMIYIVDADAQVLDDFNFDMQIPYYDFHSRKTVHVWRSRNPINDLEYGYGGVKLFPRQLTIDMDTSKPDMTTSISDSFKVMPEVSNITAFNTGEFETWKSAFRECAKLASRTIRGQVSEETEQRLHIWKTVGEDRPYGSQAIAGAIAGHKFGVEHSSDLEALSLINDFKWLEEQWTINQE
jgi:hypothetical protein